MSNEKYYIKCLKCGKRVLYSVVKPEYHDKIEAKNLRYMDGSEVNPGDKAECPRYKCWARHNFECETTGMTIP